MAKKITKTFKIKVRVKGAEKPFAEGMEPGILVEQDVNFTATEEEFRSPMFVMALMEHQEALLAEVVTTEVEEVT